MITKLEVAISNDPINNLKRKLVHDKLIIDSNLQMRHFRKIVYYENINDGSPTGAYGRPIIEAISANDQFTDEVKARLINDYQPKDANVTTVDSYVDQTGTPVKQSLIWRDSQGNIVPEGTEGATSSLEYPSGALPELEFWQNLPLAALTPTPAGIAEAVYGFLTMSMNAMDKQKRA